MGDPHHDLNQNRNEFFYVDFDVFTPRPHFIILPRNDNLIPPDFTITENNAEITRELIKTAQSMMVHYNIPNATLSIHRGSWLSRKTQKFLAHLYVDLDFYLSLFRERIDEIRNYPDWRDGHTPEGHLHQLHDYHPRSFVKRHVRAILDGSHVQLPMRVPNVIEHYDVLAHASHPKIGFNGDSDGTPESLEMLVRAMEDLAQHLNLVNRNNTNGNNGCHLCVYLSRERQERTGEVLGHIVTSGLLYYQLLDENRRQRWFSGYTVSGRIVTSGPLYQQLLRANLQQGWLSRYNMKPHLLCVT